MQLFQKLFIKNITSFVHNSNAFRDFVTIIFCMVFPCQVFVNVKTYEFCYAVSYNFKITDIKYG